MRTEYVPNGTDGLPHRIRYPKGITGGRHDIWNFLPQIKRQDDSRPWSSVIDLSSLTAALAHQFIRSNVPTSRTNEPIRPTTRRQILLAGLVCGEVGLKPTQRFWE
jgi:hypothetical protein